MSKQQTAKTLFIAVRYFVKRSGSVCCIVVSGKETYTTCLHANGRTSCTCDAGQYGRFCKHARLVVATETERVAPVVTEVEEPAVVTDDAMFFGEDGLDNRDPQSWIIRDTRAKAEHAEYLKSFALKLQACKQQSEVA